MDCLVGRYRRGVMRRMPVSQFLQPSVMFRGDYTYPIGSTVERPICGFQVGRVDLRARLHDNMKLESGHTRDSDEPPCRKSRRSYIFDV